jgi:hypothetical protein
LTTSITKAAMQTQLPTEQKSKRRTPQGELFITVPVKHASEKLIKDILIDNDQLWARKMLRTIELNYTKSPHFKDYIPTFEDIINQKHTHLSRLNVTIIKQCCEWVGITTPMYLGSELDVNADGKSERIIEICKRLGGAIYLSGSGGRKYNNENKFYENGIQLQYTSFAPQPYPQLHGEFLSGLSILDVLFNNGNESSKWL